MVCPENTHKSTIIQTEQVILMYPGIHIYVYTHANIYVCVIAMHKHIILINEKRAMNLRGSKGSIWEGLVRGRRRGKRFSYNLKKHKILKVCKKQPLACFGKVVRLNRKTQLSLINRKNVLYMLKKNPKNIKWKRLGSRLGR